MADEMLDDDETIVLPRGGYAGAVPELPVIAAHPPGLDEEWEKLWRTPQATQWAKAGTDFHLTIARLALLRAHGDDELEARRLAEILGLTDHGMAELGWVIGDVPDS
jgi:hypothetical protein